MMRHLLFFLVFISVSGCKLLQTSQAPLTINVSMDKLLTLVEQTTQEMLADQWLSDYFADNHERPILITGKISNTTTAILNLDNVYNTINMTMIKSGQVRVINSNEQQKKQLPVELVKGESIDIVICCQFYIDTPTDDQAIENMNFKMILFGDHSTQPILELINTIPITQENL